MSLEITGRGLAPGNDYYGHALIGGETLPRNNLWGTAGVSVGASGAIRLTFFTATVPNTVDTTLTVTGTTAAAATPTLCKVGLYIVESNNDLTLVASTANTTSLWASTNTEYATALQASYTFIPGRRYATGALVVSGGTTPTLFGYSVGTGMQNIWARAPRVSAAVSGQTDLPATIASGSLSAVNTVHWIGFVDA